MTVLPNYKHWLATAREAITVSPVLHRIVLLFVLLALTGAGCIRINSGGSSAALYESIDGGKTWSAADKVLTADGATSLLPLMKPAVFQFDPTDSKTIYVSSQEGKFYQSVNQGGTWLPLQQTGDPILALDVHPQHPCTFYASRLSRIEKSIDCGRRWDTIIQLPESLTVLTIRVNPIHPNMVLAGTNRGDLYVSVDNGVQWVSPLRIADRIGEILFTHTPSQDIYVLGYGGSLYRSSDLAKNWSDITAPLRTSTNGSPLTGAFLNVNKPQELYVSTQRSLVHSLDRGGSWTIIPLLTSPQVTSINTLAVDPQDPRIIYYANTTTLYRSANTGQTWQSFPLPSAESAAQLLIDPHIHGHLYLVVTL